MLILFDHTAPAPLRYALKGHVVTEAVERGWDRLVNGALLDVAEAAAVEAAVPGGCPCYPALGEQHAEKAAGLL